MIPAEKMLLGEIDALSKKTGWCDASREHFAEWLQCDATNITYYFKKLEKLGFLDIERVPGKRSRTRVIIQRFYGGEGVNGINYTREPHSPLPVNPIHPTREPHSPEIQLKENKKYKSKAPASLKAEKTLRDEGGSAAPAWSDRPGANTPRELENAIRAFYIAHPTEWKDGVLENAGGRAYDDTARKDIVKGFCEWAIDNGRGNDTYTRLNARLQKWFRDQKAMRVNSTGTAAPPTYERRKPLITA